MSISESFIEPPTSSSDADDIDSLPSSATASSADDDEYVSDAEREWRESLQQLELLLTMVMVPYLGKYFGRKCAYWGTSCLRVDKNMGNMVLTAVQVGPSSWSGNTPLKSCLPVRRRSSWQEPLRQRQLYNMCGMVVATTNWTLAFGVSQSWTWKRMIGCIVLVSTHISSYAVAKFDVICLRLWIISTS